MEFVNKRRDRTARLLKLQILLWQYPRGLNIEEIMQKLSVSKKTVYRDLKALESELGVPIWEEGTKRGIVEGYFLPPINFTPIEAVNIFLAARLMQSLIPHYAPGVVSSFMKLDSIVPSPLRKRIQQIIEYMENQSRDPRKESNFNKIAEAWLSQRRVKILFQEPSDEKPIERIIDPYFIEPVAPGIGNYIIGYCHYKKSIASYPIGRIIGSVSIEDDTYDIPKDFKYQDYPWLTPPWSFPNTGELKHVKLLFNPEVNRVITDITWHPPQKLETKDDNSIVMTIELPLNVNIIAWILGWGNNVKVLEPLSLSVQISNIAKSIVDLYKF